MRFLLPLITGTLLLGTDLRGQSDPDGGFTCAVNGTEALARRIADDPRGLEDALRAQAELDAWTAALTPGSRGTYVIPVVVHIIHNNGLENISDAQVYDAVRILNEDYNKQNPDWPNVRPEFLDIVADVGIEFRLARKDPWGNCTNGITRTVSIQTYDGDYEMTQLIQWPRHQYMNVWVAASANGAAGYTYYPMWLHNWPEADGMVLRHDYLGSIGTGHPSRSRVWTHEVGHWINLKHCWGDSNEPGTESNCWMDDDVADTPNTKGWVSCFLQGSSCGSPLDNVENYMEYSYCARMFSQGQADRMIASVTSPIAQRNELWQTGNLLATGVEGSGELCEIRFTRSRDELCAGGTVQFTDASFHGVTSRTWTFPGGTPSTSTDPAPLVTYHTLGRHDVSLTVSDGTTTLTVSEPEAIAVFAPIGAAVPLAEGFEMVAVLPTDEWLVRNPDGDATFAITDLAAYSGGRSVRLTNQPSQAGRRDELLSATYDLSGAEQITITYRYAYAQRNSGNDDRLRVWVSSNCGATWSMRQHLRGSTTLPTAGPTSGDFVPDGPGQWGHALIDNIGTHHHNSDFRVKFEFESHGGNHLYLDDININGVHVGMDEWQAGAGNGLLVLPNPTAGNVQAVFHLAADGMVRMEVFDALGRVVAAPVQARLPAGPHRMDLPLHGLAPGGYLLRMLVDDAVRTARLVRE